MVYDHADETETIARKEGEWGEQQMLMEKLVNNGAANFFTKGNIPGLEDSFVDKKDLVCCMDEGAAHMEGETKLAMAGSGILFPADSWEGRLERVADLYIKHGVTTVTSHDGCGAAGIAWRRDGEKAGTGFEKPDDYGRKWVADLGVVMNRKLGEAGKGEVVTNNISGEEMVRPKEFHNACAVWFDATGKFNPDKIGSSIPKGFLIDYKVSSSTGREEDKGYPFAELQVAINIALGDHGFGGKFTKENPFTIVVIANDNKELEMLKIEAGKLATPYDGRVKVDGFVKE